MLELGDAAGMAAGNISRLERGLTMPTIEVIERLAKGLNTFAAHIVNDRDKGPAEFAIERLCMELMASSTPRRPKRQDPSSTHMTNGSSDEVPVPAPRPPRPAARRAMPRAKQTRNAVKGKAPRK